MDNFFSKAKAAFGFMFLTAFLLMGCSKGDDDLKGDGGVTTDLQGSSMVAIDVSSMSDADYLFVCSDGSYALYDSETPSGAGVIQVNTSTKNDFANGITIVLDSYGKPRYAKMGDAQVFFSNVSDDSFDCAVIDGKGAITYHWNMKVASSGPLQQSVRGNKVSAVAKARMYGALKLVCFAVAAVGMVAAVAAGSTVAIIGATVSLVCLAYGEAVKSGLLPEIPLVEDVLSITGNTFSFLDDSEGVLKFRLNLKNVGISMVTDLTNSYASAGLASIANMPEEIRDTFEKYKDLQIRLSPGVVNCLPTKSNYSVIINSKAICEIDQSTVDRSWCNVTVDNNVIHITVDDYSGIETRTCAVTVRTKFHDVHVQPATLIIAQSGVIFELSADELAFNQNGGEQGVGVEVNGSVSSWTVTSCPVWCSWSKTSLNNGLKIKVEKAENLTEAREGVVTVTASLRGAVRIDRYLKVRQSPMSWDGTKWNFNGSMHATGNGTGYNLPIPVSNLSSFGIEIRSVDKNSFTLTGDLAGCEKYSTISCDAGGNLIWEFSQYINEGGATGRCTAKIVFTRDQLSPTYAKGMMTFSGTVKQGDVTVNADGTGEYSGSLVTY